MPEVGEPFYNVGLTEREMKALTRLIRGEKLEDGDQELLVALARRFRKRSKLLRSRERRKEPA